MTRGTAKRAQRTTTATLAAVLLQVLLASTSAKAQVEAPAVDVSPESVRLAELETLRQREQQHMATRRGFAYGALGGGAVLTVGVAVAMRFTCVIYCAGNSSAGARAGAGLLAIGLTTTVVSALAVAAYGGSVRAVRRRMFELTVTPTASLRSVGAQLDFSW